MELIIRKAGAKRAFDDTEEQTDSEGAIRNLCRFKNTKLGSPREPADHERRVRREIANSNERRRMQSINAGFQSLRSFLPQSEGEKLSKAAILQQTSDYIYQLEQEKDRLALQNAQLKKVLGQAVFEDTVDSPNVKSIKLQSDNSLQVSLSDSPEPSTDPTTAVSADEDERVFEVKQRLTFLHRKQVEEFRREINDLRTRLETERRLRLLYEDQARSLEAKLSAYQEERKPSILSTNVKAIRPNSLRIEEDEGHGSETVDDDATLIAAAQTASLNDPVPLSAKSICESRPLKPLSALPAHLFIEDRIPGLLEAAILAEPKVEVELASRVPSPALSIHACPSPSSATISTTQIPLVTIGNEGHLILQQQEGEVHAYIDIDGRGQQKTYLAHTSRQNLETIVEAIRHLEGDHLFDEEMAVPMAPPLMEVEIDDMGQTLDYSEEVSVSAHEEVVGEITLTTDEPTTTLTITSESDDVQVVLEHEDESDADFRSAPILPRPGVIVKQS